MSADLMPMEPIHEVPCPGCGALFPDHDGPTHRYLGSSAACWACFGEVLSREYADWDYHQVHRLTVDAYALQHPGEPGQQTIRSAALHGISLCAIFEKGLGMEKATRVIARATRNRQRYSWLDPPNSMAAVTIRDVHRARNAEEHGRIVRQWAESVWQAWSEHHAVFRQWLREGWES